MTAYEFLKEQGLMNKNVLAAEVNGKAAELSADIPENASVSPLTFDDAEGKKQAGCQKAGLASASSQV